MGAHAQSKAHITRASAQHRTTYEPIHEYRYWQLGYRLQVYRHPALHSVPLCPSNLLRKTERQLQLQLYSCIQARSLKVVRLLEGACGKYVLFTSVFFSCSMCKVSDHCYLGFSRRMQSPPLTL